MEEIHEKVVLTKNSKGFVHTYTQRINIYIEEQRDQTNRIENLKKKMNVKMVFIQKIIICIIQLNDDHSKSADKCN